MKFPVLLCTVAALFGATLAISTGPANAAVPGACTNRSNYHAGATSAFVSSVFGSRARIEYNNPDLCGSDSTGGSLSVAWSMVTAPSDTSPTNDDRAGWAQAGYGQFAAGSGFSATGFHVFSQYTLKCKNTGTCTGSQVHTDFGGTVTVSHFYSNVLRASDSHIHMYVDSTQLGETTYDPAGDWDAAWAGQFAGEVVHPQSDVPGTSSDVTTFDYLQKYDSAGNINFFEQINRITPQYNRHNISVTNPSVGGKGISVYTSPLTGF